MLLNVCDILGESRALLRTCLLCTLLWLNSTFCILVFEAVVCSAATGSIEALIEESDWREAVLRDLPWSQAISSNDDE